MDFFLLPKIRKVFFKATKERISNYSSNKKLRRQAQHDIDCGLMSMYNSKRNLMFLTPISDKPQLFLEKTLHRTPSVQLSSCCHPRVSGDPFFQLIRSLLLWIPAYARMTPKGYKKEVGVYPKLPFLASF
jgi:hypothetical protein